MGQMKSLGTIGLLMVIIISLFSVYTVSEREKAILFRLGEIVDDQIGPGLHVMVPFINNVKKFDARIQTLDATPERYLTSEKKNVIVDSFVKWRIEDVSKYYTATGGDESQANLRLAQNIKEGLRNEFGKRTIQEVVSGERTEIMNLMDEIANNAAKQFGIRVIDVRVKRIDLPRDVSDSVYRRMEAERERVAKDLRAKGAEAAERIRADADRQSTVIKAEAYRDAERIRGEGDAKASEIYARAFNKDPEFYSLYRSLNAYQATFKDGSGMMVLEPDAEFFKYFDSSTGKRSK